MDNVSRTGCTFAVARRCSPRSSGKPTAAYKCRVVRKRRNTPDWMSNDHGCDHRLVCPSAADGPGPFVSWFSPHTSRGESDVQNVPPVQWCWETREWTGQHAV